MTEGSSKHPGELQGNETLTALGADNTDAKAAAEEAEPIDLPEGDEAEPIIRIQNLLNSSCVEYITKNPLNKPELLIKESLTKIRIPNVPMEDLIKLIGPEDAARTDKGTGTKHYFDDVEAPPAKITYDEEWWKQALAQLKARRPMEAEAAAATTTRDIKIYLIERWKGLGLELNNKPILPKPDLTSNNKLPKPILDLRDLNPKDKNPSKK